MKRNLLAKLTALVLVVLCLFSLAACGSSKPTGVYNLESIESDGVSLKVSELKSLLGEEAGDFSVSLEIKEDGTFILNASSLDEDLNGEGTWTQSGNKLSMTADGDTIAATLKGNTISLTEDDTTMVFKK